MPPLRERTVARHLIHGSLQRVPVAVDRQEDLVQRPFISRLRAPPPIGVVLPKRVTPLAARFMRHGDTAFAQEFLYIAVAQGEAIREPDPVTDDLAGKAVVFVTRGVCGWGHAWLPILGVDWP